MTVVVKPFGPTGQWDVVTEDDLDMFSESVQKWDTKEAAVRAARRMADPGERIVAESADALGDRSVVRKGNSH